jgi:hypothetical protein
MLGVPGASAVCERPGRSSGRSYSPGMPTSISLAGGWWEEEEGAPRPRKAKVTQHMSTHPGSCAACTMWR